MQRMSRESSIDLCGAAEEATADDYASLQVGERDEEETRSTLRAMCEASRGRQLRLIRAETDSGRNDGLLNSLTCRQPSARLHFLRRSCVIYDATESLAVRSMCISRIDLVYERAIPRSLRFLRIEHRNGSDYWSHERSCRSEHVCIFMTKAACSSCIWRVSQHNGKEALLIVQRRERFKIEMTVGR